MLEANPFRGLKYKDFSNEQQWAIKLFDLKVSTLSWAGNYEGYVQDCTKAYQELIKNFDVKKDFDINANAQIVCKRYFAGFEQHKFNADVLKILSNEDKD